VKLTDEIAAKLDDVKSKLGWKHMENPSPNVSANLDEAPEHVVHDADPDANKDAFSTHEVKHDVTVGRFMDDLDSLAADTTQLNAHNEFTKEEVDRVDVACATIQDFFRGRVQPGIPPQ
jgi:hypothetical protein